MSQGPRVQPFPYTLRMAAMANALFCNQSMLLYVVPPEDALTIESLYCHFKMTFDAAIAVGNRKIDYIGVCNEVPLFADFSDGEPSYLRKFTLNQSADANRVVEARLDLSSLLDRDAVSYREYFDTPVGDNYTYVVVKLAAGNLNVATVGTINIWKLDALFTTKGIR